MTLPPHIEYFQEAATGQFNLQKCVECDLFRYPPGSLCPDCGSSELRWGAVSGKGTIHSYYFVPHAVNSAFRDWTPYPVILVELDEQRGQPTADRSLRIASNCIDADGNPEQEKNIGIGKRVETARSRSTHRRGGYRRGGRDLAECKADPSWAASITSTSGPRDILPPHGHIRWPLPG